MKIEILTLFPEFFEALLSVSILKQAISKQIVDVALYNIRDYTTDKHRTADDYPYGGGSGMILKPEPIFRCLQEIKNAATVRPYILLMSPQAQPFDQAKAIELSHYPHLVMICGHYKAVDHRVQEAFVDEELSIGDYILTGGEIPALTVMDAVVRLLPGVLSRKDSAESDSYHRGLLDTDYYTRPEAYEGYPVPEVLLSGHHERVKQWRQKVALKNTLLKRPDLLQDLILNQADLKYLNEIKAEGMNNE
ncbi:MAG: tRNA (guanosine(37)-N1)-methyltransferase TrmD [Gemmatimonadetes bacterium]|nr:MAG: tRNA (guanosine(37)-N1)-methyltransferase TrmD [Gemmatimonadota bacterium]